MMGVNIGITFSCAGIFYKPLTTDLGITVGGFGLYMTFMYIASAIMLPFAGKLLERYSARWLFTGASLLNGIAICLMGMMSHLWQFYIVGSILGISIAFLLYMSYPTLINRWFHVRMGLMIGVSVAASGLGGIIFNPIGGWIITQWGWRMAYYAFGAIIIIGVTPILAWLLRDRPEQLGLRKYGAPEVITSDKETSRIKVEEKGITYAQAIRMPMFYILLIFAFIMMGCSTLNLFIPGFTENAGFTLEQASIAASTAMVGVTLGKLLLGYINDRNCTIGVILCTIGGALGLCAIIAGTLSMTLILIGSFLFGWCYAGVTVQTAMLTKAVMGSKDYSRIFATISIALSAGGAVASGGWGLLADATSYSVIFIVGTVLLIIAAIMGIAALRKAAALSAKN